MRSFSHRAGVLDLVMDSISVFVSVGIFEKQVLRTGVSIQISRQSVPKRWFHIRPRLFYLSVSRDFYRSQLFGSLAISSYSTSP
jgi:hypothetical protein